MCQYSSSHVTELCTGFWCVNQSTWMPEHTLHSRDMSVFHLSLCTLRDRTVIRPLTYSDSCLLIYLSFLSALYFPFFSCVTPILPASWAKLTGFECNKAKQLSSPCPEFQRTGVIYLIANNIIALF